MAEAAGLVLGAFPLMIEALDAYLKAIETVRKWRNYHRTLQRTVRALKMEWRKYLNTLTLLLDSCTGSTNSDLLLLDPRGREWQEESFKDSFRAWLGPSFEEFDHAMEDMQDTFGELEEKLDLDAEYRPKWLNYSTPKKGWKTLQLSLRDDATQGLLVRLDKANKDIENLLNHRRQMNRMRPPKTTTNARRYENIRNHARNLYSVLKYTFAWPCGCAFPHDASLCIERRNGAHEASTDQKLGLHFNVVFSFEQDQSTGSAAPPWDWRETKIEPLGSFDSQAQAVGRKSPQIQITSPMVTPFITTHTSATPAPFGDSLTTVGHRESVKSFGGENMTPLQDAVRKITLSRPAKPKSVSFALTNPTTPRSPTSGDSQRSSGNSLSDPQDIEDLCKAMLNAKERSCLGVLSDEHERRHRVSISGVSCGNDPLQTVSLQELLAQARLGKKERLILGVKLASMLLQLHETPWLADTWRNVDIRFREKRDGPRSAFIGQPFITKRFLSSTCQSMPLPPDNPTPLREVRNQSTFALGLVLTELWFGKPVDHLRGSNNPDISNEPNDIIDFATVESLSDVIYDEAGDWYGDAVRRCIRCEFDQRSDSLESEGLKEAVHRMVVSPLEKNLSAFCGGSFGGVMI